MINFDKTPNEVHSEILNALPETYEKRQGFFIYDITKSFAILISKVFSKLSGIAKKLDIDNLSGEELEMFISQRTGLLRKASTYSTGALTVKGNGVILKGSLFETENLVRFESIETVAINGVGTVNIKAVLPGSNGNVVAGSITKIPITIQGIISCNNDKETTSGYEAETDTDLKIRYYEKIRTPATSGNIYHYKQWAKEVGGVGDAKVFPLHNGNNTVKVIIINNDRQPADDELVKIVQNHIDPGASGVGKGAAPIGAYCTVESAKTKQIRLSLTIKSAGGNSLEAIKKGIQSEIENYCASLAFLSNTLSYAIVGARILNVQGVLDYTELSINGAAANILCEEDEVFVLQEVILNV